jgi:(p)ppGpp synthase/HD superfamily hydrolase
MADRRHEPRYQKLSYATHLAALAHDGQFRKGEDVPYLVHPLRVGEILAHAGAADEVVIAGILHDVLEDGREEDGRPVVSAEEIAGEFSDEVLTLVEGASEPDKELSWEERKQHTLDFLETAPIGVCQIACADKLDNVRSAVEDKARLGQAFWARFNRGAAEQRWYHQSLLAVLERRVGEDKVLQQLVPRYAQAVTELYADQEEGRES